MPALIFPACHGIALLLLVPDRATREHGAAHLLALRTGRSSTERHDSLLPLQKVSPKITNSNQAYTLPFTPCANGHIMVRFPVEAGPKVEFELGHVRP
jgi:hypothetical protein